MIKKLNDKALLEKLYQLILDVDISSDERNFLVKAKNDLEKGEYTQAVVNKLKHDLAPLARSQKLSTKVVSFYAQLNQQFLERGERGTWIFPGIR